MKFKMPAITITRLLIFVYVVLLVMLAGIRIYEHNQMVANLKGLRNEVSVLQTKQFLLSQTRTGTDRIHQNMLKLWPPSVADEKTQIERVIDEEEKKNDRYLSQFRQLMTDTGEQRLFNEMIAGKKVYAKSRKRILTGQHDGNEDSVVKAEAESFEAYQEENAALASYTDSLDNSIIAKTGDRLADIESSSIYINAIIFLVVTLLGLTLGLTLRSIRATNRRLAESENKYRMLTEQTHAIINQCDRDGNIVFANDAFKKLLGYNDEDILKLKATDLCAEESLYLYNAFSDKYNFGNLVKDVELVYKSKSGKKIYVEGNILLNYDSNGFNGATGFFKDVSQRRYAQDALVALEERFRSIFNLAPTPIWVIDPATLRFIQVNKAAVKHYGYNETEFLEKTVLDIRPEGDEDFSRLKEKIKKVMEDNSQIRLSVKHIKKSGELIDMELYSTPLLLNNSPSLLTIAVDITERNQYENKLTRAILQTQEEERYVIGGELHDNVCQLLVAAQMSLAVMKKNLLPEGNISFEQSSGYLGNALQEIRNLSHRLAPVFFDETRLQDAFSRLIRTFNVAGNYKVSLYFDKTIKSLYFHEELQLNLYRILQEQLNNIFKYAEATSVEVEVLRHKDFLKMRVADNGVGFDVSKQPGGIGFANMKRRAESFSGTFMVYSIPGSGTEVIIQIPLRPGVGLESI